MRWFTRRPWFFFFCNGFFARFAPVYVEGFQFSSGFALVTVGGRNEGQKQALL
jgi:hypothetical protein